MNPCIVTKFHGKLSSSCKNVFLWNKVFEGWISKHLTTFPNATNKLTSMTAEEQSDNGYFNI